MRTLQTTPTDKPIPLPERVYLDIKDGAFAALLILAVSAVWFSRVWGQDLKKALQDFTHTMQAISDQTRANTVAVEELADHVHKVDDRLEGLEHHVRSVEQVAQVNKERIEGISQGH